MRVLVVSAHATSSSRQASAFLQLVHETLSSMAALIGSKVEVTVRKLSQLGDMVPPTPPPGATADEEVVRMLCALDSVDMILLDGDDNLAPWARAAAPLLRLLHICVVSGKPLLGSGCATNLLAYLANIGPIPIKVRSGTLSTFDPPTDASARIDKRTGDLFCWSPEGGLWVPVGNVGSRCASRHDANAGDIRKPSERNYSDGLRTCELSNTSFCHWLFRGIGTYKFAVEQRNEWSVRMTAGGVAVVTPTGAYPVQSLATSELGIQILECRHVIALAFHVSSKTAQSLTMLRNFIENKVLLLRGDAQGDVPRRMYEMWTRDPQHSDLMQQLFNSLGVMRVKLPSEAVTTTASARSLSVANVTPRPHTAHSSSMGRSAFLTALGGDDLRENRFGSVARRPVSARDLSIGEMPSATRLQPKVSRPASGQVLRSHIWPTSSRPTGRPESARSCASAGTRITMSSARSTCSTASSCILSTAGPTDESYVVQPSAALVYLDESTRALSVRASNLTHAIRGKAEVQAAGGCAQEMTFYTCKSKARPSSSKSRPGSGASQCRGPCMASANESRYSTGTSSAEHPLACSGGQEEEEIPMADRPMPVFPETEIEARVRTIRERREWEEQAPVVWSKDRAGAHFSSWHKYKDSEAANGKIERAMTTVTSSGPYYSSKEEHSSGGLISTTSDLRRMEENAAIAKALRIHSKLPYPSTRIGLGERMDRDAKSYHGFAAAGFDVPSTYTKNHGGYFNSSMVKFREVLPKQNTYM